MATPISIDIKALVRLEDLYYTITLVTVGKPYPIFQCWYPTRVRP